MAAVDRQTKMIGAAVELDSEGPFRRARNRLLAAFAAIGIVGLVLSYVPDFWLPRRPETAHETILYYFAQNLGAPALCGRISWAAFQSNSRLFAGGGASFWRSECYERVAQIRDDASICWQVRPLVDLDPLSAGYSAVSCRRRTLAGYRAGIALPAEVLVRTFERLGYDIDEMGRDPGTPRAIRWQDVYRTLERDPAVLARTQQLLTHPDASLEPQHLSYLAHLAAIGTADPRWCAYIPAGQTIAQVAGPFRDWCYLTVASNSNDTRICDRMTPASQEATVLEAEAHGVRPEIAEQLGLHTECMRSVAHVGPRLHYGAELPLDEQNAQRLFGALGVVMPSAHDWPVADIARFYQGFLFSLWPAQRPDVDRDAARATLVARLLALPNTPERPHDGTR
jgi:hypothetical protein